MAVARTVLAVDGLVGRFGELVAVDDVSFRISAGETYGLLGPNGAGKTTTISMVSGLLEADAGRVEVAGSPMGRGTLETRGRSASFPRNWRCIPI